MKSIKFNILHKNYISVGNAHIFINFTRYNLEMMNQSHPDNFKKIHVFITNHASINESLRNLITRYGLGKEIKGRTCHPKVIIHFPYRVTDLRNLLVKFLKSNDITSGYTMCFDRYPVRFRQPGYYGGNPRDAYGPTDIVVHPKKNVLSVKIESNEHIPKIVFPDYPYNVEDGNEDERSIFDNMNMRMNPEEFKPQLVAAFKEKTPPGILKAFKNDDEIFAYIVQEGEWKVEASGEAK